MGRHREIGINEDLESLLRKEQNKKNVLRIQSLLHIKLNTFSTQEDLVSHLDYVVRSMEKWLKLYKDFGLEKMLLPEKQTRRRLISKQVHEGLLEREDPKKRFS